MQGRRRRQGVPRTTCNTEHRLLLSRCRAAALLHNPIRTVGSNDGQASPTYRHPVGQVTIRELLPWMRDHLLAERPELFMKDDSVCVAPTP